MVQCTFFLSYVIILFDGAHAVHRRAMHFRTQRHFARRDHAIDMISALYHIGYVRRPSLSESYEQVLHLYSATAQTSYTLEDGTEVRIRTFMHPRYPELLSFVLEYCGEMPTVALCPEQRVDGHYGQSWCEEVTVCDCGFDVRTNTCSTSVRLRVLSERGTASIGRCGDAICVNFSRGKGRHLLTVAASTEELQSAAAEMGSVEDWISSAADAWQSVWGDAYVMIPDPFVARMMARSVYLLLSSFSEKKSAPSAPMGYTGYGWPFSFPQDISFLHPALLRLGKIEHAKRIVEHYRETLEDMEAISRRIYGGSGVMWPWIYPLGEGTDYLHDGAPNPYYYEIHNAAYPARMAYETALQAGDDDWTREVALPVIRASAEFYASHLSRGPRGTWDLWVIPSMSQDEFAKQDRPNYLCAMYAARYSLTLAVRMGCAEYEKYLADGLSFEALLDRERMLYRTSAEMEETTWGREKHPVQLNPLIFLPCGSLNAAERNAYASRAEICEDTKRNFYHGWTLGAFWLAASHAEDADALYRDLHRGDDGTFHDAEGIAFYETTNHVTAPYYVTTHGFWLQAVLDAFVSDYFGETRICASVPAEWRGAEYHGLCTKDGRRHGGTVG